MPGIYALGAPFLSAMQMDAVATPVGDAFGAFARRLDDIFTKFRNDMKGEMAHIRGTINDRITGQAVLTAKSKAELQKEMKKVSGDVRKERGRINAVKTEIKDVNNLVASLGGLDQQITRADAERLERKMMAGFEKCEKDVKNTIERLESKNRELRARIVALEARSGGPYTSASNPNSAAHSQATQLAARNNRHKRTRRAMTADGEAKKKEELADSQRPTKRLRAQKSPPPPRAPSTRARKPTKKVQEQIS